jgi:inorganic triphosphatase YgiF
MILVTDVHTEIEQKYDVTSSFVLPALDTALPGASDVETTVTELQAIYFDTADLRLAHRKITLRRRTGGADQGWHLKLPVGKGERTEFHEPYTDELEVPEPLSRLVSATTRGAALTPVARLETTRTAHRLSDESGQVMVEVAEDTVTGQTLGEVTQVSSWREVEVELVEGERQHLDRLAKILGNAGALPSASGSKLARTIGVSGRTAKTDLTGKKTSSGELVLAYLRKQQSALLSIDPAVRLDRPEAVHKMRVASRRLRSALKTFDPLFAGEVHIALEDGLGLLADVLGHERDAEVLLARMRTSLDELPPDLVMGPVRHDVESWMGDTYFAAKQAAHDYLAGGEYLELLNQLDAFVTSPPLSDRAVRPARTEMAALVNKTVTKVRRQGMAALATEAGPPRDLALHDARRAAKRSRYAADVYALSDPKSANVLSLQMAQLQETLGERHDGAVMALLLRDFAARTGAAGGNGFTYGFLLAREEGRGVNAERDFAAALKRVRPFGG